MATCNGWYYTKPAWHKDAIKSVTGASRSGLATKSDLAALKSADAKIFVAYLADVHTKNVEEGLQRDPFGCAEPDAVYQLLKAGAEINQIFIGITNETYYNERLEGDDSRMLKPCVNCRQWLTAQLKDGSYMVDMGALNQFVRTSKLSWQ